MNHRLHRLRLCLCICFVCLLCGCFEKERTFIINPDGSGKVLVREMFWLPKELNDAYAQLDDTRKAEFNRQWRYGFAEGVMLGSSSIETWKDVTCEPAGTGRWQFKGTAYFRNLGDASTTLGEMHANVSGTGELVLDLFVHRDRDSESRQGGESMEKLLSASPERRDEAVRMLNDWVKQLYNASIKVRFQLPGEPTAADGTAIAVESLAINLDGAAIKATAEAVSSNVVAEIAGNGGEAGANLLQQTLAKKLLGENFGRRVLLSGQLRQQFDYTAEVFAARREFPGMIKELGCKDPKLSMFRDAVALPQNPRGATNLTDLGFSQLRAGAKGKLEGAEIRSVATVSGQSSVILKLTTPKEKLASLSIYDDEGTQLDGRVTSSATLGGATVITWRTEGAMPVRGAVKVRLK